MGKKNITNALDAPTEPADWIGAAEVRPSDPTPARSPGAIMFQTYRASTDSCLSVIIGGDDRSRLPPCPGSGSWEFFKRFPETGQPRIGFSEDEAKSDIRNHGYHVNRVDIDLAVGLAPPKAS